MKSTDWTDRLKAQLDEYASPVDPALWEAVHAGLPRSAQAVETGGPFRLKRKPLFWTAGAAAALALGLFLGLRWGAPTQDKVTMGSDLAVVLAPPPAEVPQVTAQLSAQAQALSRAKKTRPASAPTPEAAPLVPVAPAQPSVPDEGTERQEGSGSQNVGKENVGKEGPGSQNVGNQSVGNQNVGKENVGKANSGNDADRQAREKARKYWEEGREPSRKRGGSRWALGIYAANGSQTDGLGSLSEASPILGPMSDALFAAPPYLADKNAPVDYTQWVESVRRNPPASELNFELPVSWGLSLRWKPHPRYGLETGLQYTSVGAGYHARTRNAFMDVHQQLHYLGIPLQLQFSFLAGKRVDLYLSAGGALERMVACRSTEQITLGVQQGERKHETFHAPVWQSSVGAHLGLQYSFVSRLGLYAELGLNHYFHDGSSLPTPYHDKPTLFHARAGLRFTLAGM